MKIGGTALKREKGALTVEATLVFPIYIITILTVISFLNIFYTHAVMQQALNNTALRIAEYSYALKVTGSLDVFEWTDEADAKLTKYQGMVEKVSASAQDTMESFSKGFTIETISETVSNAKEFGTSVDTLAEALSSENTESLGEFAVGIFLGSAIDTAGDSLVEALVKSYLTDMKLNLNNIENMDFSMSKFYYGENQDITLVVTYEYHNPLGIKFFDSVKLLQTCTVHPWIGTKG